MAQRFGSALRKARRQAHKTLGELGRALSVSIVYVSDVERGNRKPFSSDRILQAAEFLQTDAAPLLEAAARDRGVIEYDITKARPLEVDVVGGLVSGLARGGVTDDQLCEIRRILERKDENDGE